MQKICARLHIEPEPPPAPSKPSLYTRLGEAQSAELVEECQRMYEVVPDKRAALGEELRRRLAIAAPRAGGSVEAVYIQQRVTGQDVVDAAYRGYRRVAGEPIGEPQYQPYHLAPGQMLDDAKRFSNTALVEALVRPESYDRNERYALVGELHRRLGKLA